MQPLSFKTSTRSPSHGPLVIGHRGASHDQPENTLLAFREAMQQGADGVELDVMLCGSGEVVVVHDDTLTRLAVGQPGADLQVRKATLDELRRFDIGKGERIPTLFEVFELLGPKALVNVELKSQALYKPHQYLRLPFDDGLAGAVAKVLRKCDRLSDSGSTLVSSFDPFQLLRFQSAAQGRVPLGYLFEAGQGELTRELHRLPLWSLLAVHPEAKLIDAPSMRRWRRRGLRVNTWTVDRPSEVAAVATLGVDAIITNRPSEVRAVLAKL